MRQPIDMNEIQRQLQSQAAELSGPPSTPPSLSQLSGQVAARRHRRAVALRVASSGAAVACVLLIVFSFNRNPPADQDSMPVAVTPGAGQLAVLDADSGGTVSDSGTAIDPDKIREKMRFLARVRQPRPVYRIDRESNQLRYVGWIEDEQTVPVELNPLSNEQEANIKRVSNRPNVYDL